MYPKFEITCIKHKTSLDEIKIWNFEASFASTVGTPKTHTTKDYILLKYQVSRINWEVSIIFHNQPKSPMMSPLIQNYAFFELRH